MDSLSTNPPQAPEPPPGDATDSVTATEGVPTTGEGNNADEGHANDEGGTWWSRPAGAREVLAVAAPLMVSALSWTVMTFVDRMFLRWESGDAMAAAFSGGTTWFAVLCFPLGVCTYASTFVSQYFGADQREKIGPITWQAVWLGLAFSPLMLAAGPVAPTLFENAGHTAVITGLEISYFQVLCWGAPAMLIAQALSGFYSGRGETRVVMVVDALFAAVNLGLDWLWIFGHYGFPAMGIEGAAWATVCSLWLKVAAYAWLVTLPAHRSIYNTLSLGFDAALTRRLLRYGGPSGLQMLLDVAGFTVFILLCGRLGDTPFEATSMAFNISSLAFMPVWGMSLATSILVGQHLGEDRDDLAARATWTTFGMALVYMAVVSALYVCVPDLFLYGFFAGSGEPVDRTTPVYLLAVTLLRFVAAYNLLDAAVMIFAGAIKGAGDTRFVLAVSIVMAVALATVSWLTVDVWNLGVFGCWYAITGWIWVVGIVFFLRFLQGKWRSMRVIEQTGEPGPNAG
ncbi:MAG: MATE family efflux transporter [Planctomycetota bacterium]